MPLSNKRALQAAVAIAGMVPVAAGLWGILDPEGLALTGPAAALTHAAYLSGLLLGIGLAYWSLIPTLERQDRRFGMLTAIVALGGAARLLLALRLQVWNGAVAAPLVMELGVAPALWLWRWRLVRSSNSPPE